MYEELKEWLASEIVEFKIRLAEQNAQLADKNARLADNAAEIAKPKNTKMQKPKLPHFGVWLPTIIDYFLYTRCF